MPHHTPVWWQSPKVIGPVALVIAALLLAAFASVVQDIVTQGESGNGLATGRLVAPTSAPRAAGTGTVTGAAPLASPGVDGG